MAVGEFKMYNGYPACTIHGAMLKVTPEGLWRCPQCHIGYWEKENRVLKENESLT